MEALYNWVALSSGTGLGVENGTATEVTRIPGALVELLGNFGVLAGALADLVGLVA
ncbi:hypothetical protein SAMN04488531_0672 [Corynebacterium coyleae]|uniref:Uncharacterized protein n=1 Tax=Corynebacterium coyleae TaxID=53374 RepID=A0AAP6XL99_9CORY|nr:MULTISPECIES: hypothetical protein [Corynebacterium]MDK6493990.1 hypothetical protein [Corynebacterium coyleae]MDK8242038.1 hypothetical protein [Corynebacterium coyleae]MDK8799757.1 hypothetical protein [Corynebacterium coyleae]NJJ04469.1 hypothetical protein [Corynebacterium coyleae]QXB19074.1 hypothetical protein I6L55_03030 [Corynebacterium coyleae]